MFKKADVTQPVDDLQELAKLLGEAYRGYKELKRAVLEPVSKPVEEYLREVLGEIIYRQLTDLGQAKELSRDVDLKALYEEILRRHVGRIQQ
jgi:hypothetical protein